jgi:hypothetical protein
MTPRLTLATVAEMDLQDTRDFNVGVMIGVHVMPYDGAR